MPRFSPFTNFLTQGMQNTNKNINKLNMPSFGQGGGQGGGSIMGGASQGGAQYGGGPGGGGMEEWDPTWFGAEPGTGLGYPGSWSGGIFPSEEEPPTSFEASKPGFMQGPPQQPTDPLPPGYEWQFVNGNWEPVPISGYGGGTIDPGYPQEPHYQGIASYIPGGSTPLSPTSPTEFAGGGGQGGQAAKKLYYPGTQGGFASVGSGIGGQTNILDDLLKQLQG